MACTRRGVCLRTCCAALPVASVLPTLPALSSTASAVWASTRCRNAWSRQLTRSWKGESKKEAAAAGMTGAMTLRQQQLWGLSGAMW